MAAARIMQSSSNELSTLVSGKVSNVKQNESYNLMPHNSRADEVRLKAERYYNKSNIKCERVLIPASSVLNV